MRTPHLLVIAIFTIVASLTQPAQAQEPELCSVAYARGQEERLAGRLYNARAAFLQCRSSGCSTALTSDCDRWVKEVEADLPTIRLSVLDSRGAPVDSAKVSIDGAAVSRVALSAPIVLEAGPHELRVEAPGYRAVQLEKALRPSDREVRVVVRLSPPRPPQPSPEKAGVPTASWVLAGIGGLALGGSIYFGVRASNEYDDLKGSCAPACAPSASDGMHTKAVVADVALTGAIVALAASAVIYFTRSTR